MEQQQAHNRLLASSTNPTVNVNLAPPLVAPFNDNLPEITDEFVRDEDFENNDYSESETETVPFMMKGGKINPDYDEYKRLNVF